MNDSVPGYQMEFRSHILMIAMLGVLFGQDIHSLPSVDSLYRSPDVKSVEKVESVLKKIGETGFDVYDLFYDWSTLNLKFEEPNPIQFADIRDSLTVRAERIRVHTKGLYYRLGPWSRAKASVTSRARVIWSQTAAFHIILAPPCREPDSIRAQSYLENARSIAEFMLMADFQQVDGSWRTDLTVSGEHKDAELYNHGIILKGLAMLYVTVKGNDPIRPDLKNAIIASINHLIDYNGATPWGGCTPSSTSRIIDDSNKINGLLAARHICDDNRKVAGEVGVAAQGETVIQGLIRARDVLRNELSQADLDYLDEMIDRAVAGLVGHVNNQLPTPVEYFGDRQQAAHALGMWLDLRANGTLGPHEIAAGEL